MKIVIAAGRQWPLLRRGDIPTWITGMSHPIFSGSAGRQVFGRLEAYGQHDMLQHGQQPIPAANGTRQRTGSADGKTG